MPDPFDNFELGDRNAAVVEVIRPHFQPEYYLSHNPDVARAGVDPLLHYALYGWREGRDPNPEFSTRLYLIDNPEVVESGVHPFWHFIEFGKSEGRQARRPERSATPDADRARLHAEGMDVIRPHFDAAYYVEANPDVTEAGADPLHHYYHYGWKEGRDPTADFSTLGYLRQNPDVNAAAINPFWHYHVSGKSEGRVWAVPDGAPASAPPRPTSARVAQEVAAIRDDFDRNYYLRHNPDVAEAGIDPVEHFVVSGWSEGRNPTRFFSVAYYLELNPDVRELQINPFWHYVVAGKEEGRLARHPGGYRAETLIQTRPLEATVKAWRSRKPPTTLLDAKELRARILDAGRTRSKLSWRVKAPVLMISVGHDNYREISGGVQYCIHHEEDTARARGILYLNLHPQQPLPRLAHADDAPDVLVSMLLGGKPIGTAPMSAVIAAARMLADDCARIDVVVHHLMGHSPEQIADMIEATGAKRCFLWLHDFFTLCPSYALQRNNVNFCGAPPPELNACTLCLYGVERQSHRARIAAFFARLPVHVIAPSQFAADYWLPRSHIKAASLRAQPHMVIDWTNRRKRAPADPQTISIGFIGFPAPHKGWPVFERLVRENRGEGSRFRFIYFGTSRIALDGVESVPVHVTAADPDAMIRAIADTGVDLVLHWATCAETFSFSTHEALAGGALVLTNPISGNVAVSVRKLGLGAVLEDEADLDAFFDDGRLQRMVADLRTRRRSRTAALSRSNMTFSVLDEEGVAPMTIHAFTSFSYSYLNRARVLAKTLKALHPDWTLWAVLTDKEPAGFTFDLDDEDFDGVMTAQDLFGDETETWLFGHDVVEACTAVKGKASVEILNLPGCDKLVYFDPDIALVNSMDDVIDLLDTHSIVLTPHQIDPEPRANRWAIQDNEIASLNYGVFNLGFVAMANDAEGRRFAQWWDDRLRDWCHDRLDIGVFVDQKWCNLVPCFFDNVKVLRDPGYNVASWNLSQRKMRYDDTGTALINDRPLRFYHFTKLGPVGDTMTQRYARDNTEVYELWWWYRQQVLAATAPAIPKGWWHYGTFDNGEKIPKPVRELYRARGDLRRAFPNPLRSGEGSFHEWLQGNTDLMAGNEHSSGFHPV